MVGSKRQGVAERLKSDGLVAIVRGDFTLAEQRLIAEALAAGGVKVLEVTLNTTDALESIAALHRDFDDLLVGAGTVRTAEDAKAALEAGAQFLIAPCLDGETIKVAHDHDTLILPGIFTATEAQTAFRAGCTMLKLFPADALGPTYLKALRAPLDDIDFVPTGGVNPETIASFHEAGAAAFGIGSYLVKNVRVTQGEADALTRRAQRLREALGRARGV